jgi:predicted aspartyl protease
VAEFNEEYTITGPRGSKSGVAFVDTGASFTVLPKPVADQLGITSYRPETVDTNNGPVSWGVGRAEISVGGKPARDQDVFIAPADNPLAIGAESLQISGFKLRANAARARLAICQGCPAFEPHPYLGPKCTDCGCLLKLKTALPGQSCPRGFW